MSAHNRLLSYEMLEAVAEKLAADEEVRTACRAFREASAKWGRSWRSPKGLKRTENLMSIADDRLQSLAQRHMPTGLYIQPSIETLFRAPAVLTFWTDSDADIPEPAWDINIRALERGNVVLVPLAEVDIPSGCVVI